MVHKQLKYFGIISDKHSIYSCRRTLTHHVSHMYVRDGISQPYSITLVLDHEQRPPHVCMLPLYWVGSHTHRMGKLNMC